MTSIGWSRSYGTSSPGRSRMSGRDTNVGTEEELDSNASTGTVYRVGSGAWTLNHALTDVAARRGDHPFLRIDGEDTSFSAFADQVARLAAGLRLRGVSAGDRVSVVMNNSKACVLTWFATNWLGAVWVPTNTGWKGDALNRTIGLAEPRILLCDDDLVDELGISPEFDPVRLPGRVTASGRTAADVTELMSDVIAPAVDVDPGSTSAMLYTSGSTGLSKLCVLSHAYFQSMSTILLRDMGFTAEDVLYCPFPLFHADATVLTVIPALQLGATAAISRRFTASGYWNEIRETRATVFDFMGATLSILQKAPSADADADNPARLAWGVPVPMWAADFERRFGLEVLELYGSTEVSLPITQRHDQPKVVGSCGRVVPEFDVRLVGADGEPVADGDAGELWVRPRTGVIFDGYFRDTKATEASFEGDWFKTGDLLRRDEEGNYFFVSRNTDTIRRRGENISALEVEEGIERHPDVVECAAVGVVSELTEEDVKVYVIARPGSGLSVEQVWSHADAVLARFQVPRYVCIVDQLPKTPTGKIDKPHLRECQPAARTWDRENFAPVRS